MDIFVSLAIIVGLVWGVSKIPPSSWSSTSANGQPPTAAPSSVATESPALKSRRVLAIEGAIPVKPVGGFGFIKSFGLNPDWLTGMVQCTGPGLISALPDGVQRALHLLYAEGALHGTEVVSLLENRIPLAEGRAIYFAMLAPPSGTVHAIGFVDKANR